MFASCFLPHFLPFSLDILQLRPVSMTSPPGCLFNEQPDTQQPSFISHPTLDLRTVHARRSNPATPAPSPMCIEEPSPRTKQCSTRDTSYDGGVAAAIANEVGDEHSRVQSKL